MAKRKRTPEENARREAIRELLQMSNIESIESADEVNGVTALLIALMETGVRTKSWTKYKGPDFVCIQQDSFHPEKF